MTITQESVNCTLTAWQNLASSVRDKIVFDALFTHDEDESTPMFSDNIKDNADTDSLISKLDILGVDKVTIERAPRSSLSIVKCGNVVIPLMPAHKAIGYIGYLVAISQDE